MRAATAGAFAGLRQRQLVTTERCGRQLLRSLPASVWEVFNTEYHTATASNPSARNIFHLYHSHPKNLDQTLLFCLVSRYHLDEAVATFELYVCLHYFKTVSDIISRKAFVLLSTEVVFSIILSSFLHAVDTLVPGA